MSSGYISRPRLSWKRGTPFPVSRSAVSSSTGSERAQPHLRKAPGGAAEGVTLRPAPMLAVDPAQSLAAAAKAQPHRQPGLKQRLDGGIGRTTHQRQRLDQDQIGALLLEGARQQP